MTTIPMTQITTDVEHSTNRQQHVGAYTIEELVSVGKRAIVYRGHSQKDGSVAVKILHKNLCSNQKELLRFYDDAKVSMQFDHPHVLPVLEVNEDAGQHYVVTPWATKGSLKDFVNQQGPLWEDEAIALVEKLQSGLCEIQSCLGYHGRLHTGNIFMLDRHTPCITGVSRLPVNGEKRKTNKRVSTQVACAAPEVIDNHEEFSGVIDQYSLATILYYMLTGRLPSGRSSLNKLLKSRLRDHPRWQQWLPTTTSPEVLQALKFGMRTPEKRSVQKPKRKTQIQKTTTAQVQTKNVQPTNLAKFSTYAKQFAASILLLNSLR